MHSWFTFLVDLCFCFLSEDLSKSEDKEDMKEVEDGKGAKKKDDPDVNSAFIPISCIYVFSAATLYLHLQISSNLKLPTSPLDY